MDLINIIKKNKKLLFTTPGHFQGAKIPPRVGSLLGKKVFEADLSEIVGLDNIRDPQGVLLEAQKKSAEFYGAKNTFYLFNGSTSGILATMLATAQKGEKVIIARNSHISVVNALVLSGAVPVWVNPDWDEKWNVARGVNVSDIKNAIDKNPDAKAVWITSPTYEGVVSDIPAISQLCKEKGLLLVVDEAHGALFPFSERLPESAIQGADACVQSLHKTALSLTQSAVLHIGKNSAVCPDKIQRALNIINSTSPSYPLLASLDGCIKYLASSKGKGAVEEFLDNIEEFRKNISEHPRINLYKNDDKTKLLINIEGLSGEEISEKLYERFNIENEYENEHAILCLTGVGTTKKKLKKLENALIKIAKKSKILDNHAKNDYFKPIIAEMVLTPSEAHYSPSQKIAVADCIGKVSAETITPYPPGIPVLVAGERISQAHFRFLVGQKFINIIL